MAVDLSTCSTCAPCPIAGFKVELANPRCESGTFKFDLTATALAQLEPGRTSLVKSFDGGANTLTLIDATGWGSSGKAAIVSGLFNAESFTWTSKSGNTLNGISGISSASPWNLCWQVYSNTETDTSYNKTVSIGVVAEELGCDGGPNCGIVLSVSAISSWSSGVATLTGIEVESYPGDTPLTVRIAVFEGLVSQVGRYGCATIEMNACNQPPDLGTMLFWRGSDSSDYYSDSSGTTGVSNGSEVRHWDNPVSGSDISWTQSDTNNFRKKWFWRDPYTSLPGSGITFTNGGVAYVPSASDPNDELKAASEFTLAAYGYSGTSTGEYYIVGFTGVVWGLALLTSGGDLICRIHHQTSGTDRTDYSLGTASGKPYRLILTYVASTTTLTLYSNGVSLGSGVNTGYDANDNGPPIWPGPLMGSSEEPKGAIIYDGVLGAAQIAALDAYMKAQVGQ